MTSASATSAPVSEVAADTVVIGMADGPNGVTPVGDIAALDAAFGGRLAAILSDLGATGKAGDLVRFASLGAIKASTVLAAGLGTEPTADTLRRASGEAARALAGTATAAFAITGTSIGGSGPTGEAALRSVAEGALLGAYSFTGQRTPAAAGRPPVGEIVLVVSDDRLDEATAAARRAVIVVEAVALTRDLVNTPPNSLPPAVLAQIAQARATEAGADAEVLDEAALAAGGFGGILGVGQGSANPPRLVRVSWVGPGAEGRPAVALVGKGITFDSGGLSLKPPVSMEWMKTDMAGAAAVLSTVVAAARLNLPVAVTGWLPLAENMPSGSAIRPSDVLTMRGGTRVEVLNTDAEGRLVLADALTRAAEESPSLVIDVATLTGAQIVSLGSRTSGVMGRDGAVATVVTAAERAGEAVWAMPMPPELRKGLDSAVADIANVPKAGGRDGGMLVAAHFLATFVPDELAWAHIDIAGPSWNSAEPYGYVPKGGTGVIVRTLLEVLEAAASRD
jgi:leucyl aminopeptidase